MNLEHSRYRSPKTISVNVLSALMVYCFKDQKPHLYITEKEQILTQKLRNLAKNEPKIAIAA